MSLLPADYVLCGLALVMAVTGLFRGFSGTLAFVLAVAAGGIVAFCGWSRSEALTDVMWMRAAGTLVATLLAFGLVRLVVKKLVNGLLAQPSDALFGALVGVVFALLLLFGWARSGLYLEHSNLAQAVAAFIGDGAGGGSDK